MKPALLDVNVLIALIDPSHEFHDSAHGWFQRNWQFGWATCPVTENACLRILGKSGYPNPGLTVDRVRDILTGLTRVHGHRFWPDSISMLDSTRFDLTGVGPKNVTDVYLLGLAIGHGGRLITFDRGVPEGSVMDCGPDQLEILT